MMEKPLIRIGCPVWMCPHWRGQVYRAGAPKSKWLADYSRVFSTVEGNSTFYGIPKTDTFKRWADETADGFKFALKFPRVISHDRQLRDAGIETDAFLEGVSILHEADRLGPTFLQLPPFFEPRQFGNLQAFMQTLPGEFPYAVEVRHPDWFRDPAEQELNSFLTEHEIDRVIFDSRPLFSKPPVDEIETAAQQRKPQVPVRTNATGNNPILRLIGRNDVASVSDWVDEWSKIAATWVEQGKSPYLFAHAPDDQFAPELALMLDRAIGDSNLVHTNTEFREPPKVQQQLF